jgi:tetratricopeptide (TPR) repeat protein
MHVPALEQPHQRRLDRVRSAWSAFAEHPRARLLCLRVTPEERGLVSRFAAETAAERVAECPDLLVALSSPFGASDSYGLELCAEFVERTRLLPQPAARTGGAWAPPPPQPGASGVAALRELLGSFSMHHALPGCLALVLAPDSVAAPDAFALWLQELIADLPAQLRVVALDAARSPAFQRLVEQQPLRVVSHSLEPSPSRVEEAPRRHTPESELRDLLAQLRTRLGAGELDQALDLGQRALGIAAAQRWFAPAVPIHFALALGLAGARRFAEAEGQYLEAEFVALKGEKAGDTACRKLRLRARLARGALLLSEPEYARAAELFQEALALALALGDARAALDCHRHLCCCHERTGHGERAWQAGSAALRYARGLAPAALRGSSLPQLGELLLRLADEPEYSDARAWLQRELAELMGRAERRAPSADRARQLLDR